VTDLLFWLAAAVCLACHAAILRSVLRSAFGAPQPDAVPVRRRVAEVVWAILPALVLAAVFVATWRSMHTRV
jgi:hypothetical protein